MPSSKPGRTWSDCANLYLFAAAVLLIGTAAFRADAGTGRVTFDHIGPGFQARYTAVTSHAELAFRRLGDFDAVELEGADYLAEAGRPMLPARIVRIALPAGTRVTAARVLQTHAIDLDGKYLLWPAQPPRPISVPAGPADFVPPDPATYASTQPWPAELVQVLHQTDLAGQGIAVLRVCPVQYVPGERRLILHETIEVLLEGSDGYQPAAYLPADASPLVRQLCEEAVAAVVENPADIALVEPPDPPVARGVSPGNYTYVIITPAQWTSAWQPLVDWKTRKGVPATVVTTEWIFYSAGYSGTNVEKIAAFVQDAFTNWGAVYFLLGGDTDTVPCHYRHTVAGGYTEDIPNDTFYADFGANWSCDVHVGRAAVRNAAGIANFITKVLRYEKTPPLSDYATTAFFCGFDLDSATPSEAMKETIRSTYIPPTWTYRQEYDSEPGTHKADVIAFLNQGNNLVNHSDHSSTNYMGTGYTNHNQGLNNSDMSALTNGQRQSILYSLGCWACDYPATTCIAEAFVQNGADHGGGIAFVGNSRYGWYYQGMLDGLSARFDRCFFQAIFSAGAQNLGAAFSWHKNTAHQPDGVYNWIFTELTLLGDPELPILTADPQPLSVLHDPTLALNILTNFAVQVTTGGNPLIGARVCLYKPGDVYAVGLTGDGGVAQLPVRPTSPGTMYVTVTRPNYLPYEGVATIYMGGNVTLTVNVLGGGSVSVDPPGESYTPGTTVQLTAHGTIGWAFSHWEGHLSGSANPASLLMDGDKLVTAVFAIDCNGNGVPDTLDVAAGTSLDCNGNEIPDECDLANCAGNAWCDDCNGNGMLDACDLVGYFEQTSPPLSPLGDAPQVYTFSGCPEATDDAVLTFNAFGDINALDEYVTVTVNGQLLGTIYNTSGYYACMPAQQATLSVPRALFNSLRAAQSGQVTVTMSPSSAVDPWQCSSQASFIQVTLSYPMSPPSLDLNQDGIPDECQPATCAGDMNCDGTITFADIDRFVEALAGPASWPYADCPWLNADCTGDGEVTFADIDAFVARLGMTCP